MSLHILYDSGFECIRVFKDRKDARIPFVGHRNIRYKSPEYFDLVDSTQSNGGGVFFSVNQTDGVGARNENIVRIRSYFVDIDGLNANTKNASLLQLITAPLQPSAIVETKNGLHAYWYANEQTPVDQLAFAQVQRGLITYFGGDKSVVDVARVLRMPETWHLKDPEAPYLVRVVHQLPEHQTPYYTRKELLAAYPSVEQKKFVPPPQTTQSRQSIPGDWGRIVRGLERWNAQPGERNRIIMLAAGAAIWCGVNANEFKTQLTRIAAIWGLERNIEEEVDRITRWAYGKNTPLHPAVLRSAGVPVTWGERKR
jgi:hypothetical protein